MTNETPPDKPELKPASRNPWYVLMTVAGEQTGTSVDMDLHARNRRYFNGWMAQHLSEEQKKDLKEKKRASAEDLADLTEEEQAEIARQIAERCPDGAALTGEDARVNLAGSEVAGRLICIGFVFSGDADFSDATFSGYADFHDATFSGSAIFSDATFSRYADFSDATFSGDADFRDATFSGDADFSDATFSGYADFHDATFSGSAVFSDATFSGDASFRDPTFSRNADFRDATFSGAASFGDATFSGAADFSDATFSRDADFENATFSGNAVFRDATFKRVCDFSDATFKAKTVFAHATFQRPTASPPLFYNATLHEDTTWEGIYLWPLPGPGHNPEDFVRAYERLKLLMDDQNKLYAEHMFHRLELRCREIARPRSLTKYGSILFRRISDYGWSVKRPAIAAFCVTILGWMVIFLNQALTYGPDKVCRTVDGVVEKGHLLPLDSVKLAVSNLFGFLGFNRTFLRDKLACLTPLSEVVSMTQTFLGVILVFLIGLALRNRFRIK